MRPLSTITEMFGFLSPFGVGVWIVYLVAYVVASLLLFTLAKYLLEKHTYIVCGSCL